MSRRVERRISLLVPFQTDEWFRVQSWKWLEEYWRIHLPDAEIIIGKDRESHRTWYRRHPKPFSKAVAVNEAFKRSHGDIIVILDADAYLSAHVVKHCAERIRFARDIGVHLWFVPYLRLFRLKRHISDRILNSAPWRPLRLPDPPPSEDVENTPEASWYGHRYGAMIMIVPREAFELVHGFNEKFRGWGGEDVAFLRSVDTLYGKHKNTDNDVLHLWHPQFVTDEKVANWTVRVWEGQTSPRANDKLATRYHKANGNPEAMQALVDGR